MEFLGDSLLNHLIFWFAILSILILIVIFILFRIDTYKNSTQINIYKTENKYVFDWYINYSITKDSKVIDTSLIFLSKNNKEFLRLKNPPNVGNYFTSESFVYKNISFEQPIHVIFKKHYLVSKSKVKTKIIFKTVFLPNIVLVNNFSSNRLRNGKSEVKLELEYYNKKVIQKFNLFIYSSEDIETDRPIVKEITNIKKNYDFIIGREYVCIVIQILYKDYKNSYFATQTIDKILYL